MINTKYADLWPVITKAKDPPKDAKEWDKLEGYKGDKTDMFDPEPGTGDE
jgi:hypothetical protein